MGKNFLGLDGLKHFWSKAKTWIAEQITAEVTAKIAEIVANAPEDLDTLKEIADWISAHANDASAMNTAILANTEAISGKADKNHTHTKSQITDFDALPVYSGNLNDLHSSGFAKYRATYSDLTNAPAIPYTPQICYIDVWSDTANTYQMIRIVGITYNPVADYGNTYIRSSHYTGSEYVWSAWRELATSADLVDKQDFRIFNSLEEFNKKKGTSLTVVSGIDNMKDIVNAMSNGEILIIITKYELGSDVYFGLTTDTGWTKMFTFVKSNGLCDVECRTTFPLTFKRVLNSDGVVGDWQQLVTTDDIFRVGNRRNTIGWADLSKDVNIDGSSNYANNVCRIEGHNALIEVSNPSIGYQWPVTNSGDNNTFMDFGGTIQFFVDKINNHLYVRFADSVDMSAWGEIATMDKVAREVDTSYMSNGVLNILAIRQALGTGCYEIMGQGNSGHGSIRLNIWQLLSGAFAFSCCITDFSGIRSICNNEGDSTTVDVGTSYFSTTNRIVKIF